MNTYRIVALFFVTLGLALVGTAAFPIAHYELFTARKFAQNQNNLLSPLAKGSVGGRIVDLTQASNWFVGTATVAPGEVLPTSVLYYTISIPKLRIENATAEIGGEDLSRSLIHYKGTAAPGRVGNTVIFGHSVLPQFFNSKNYLTIFSTLPSLKVRDEIIVDYDAVRYKFIVSEMFEVEPEDIRVLAQPNDKPHLTLITCVPPGTYLRRLVVRAELAGDQI